MRSENWRVLQEVTIEEKPWTSIERTIRRVQSLSRQGAQLKLQSTFTIDEVENPAMWASKEGSCVVVLVRESQRYSRLLIFELWTNVLEYISKYHSRTNSGRWKKESKCMCLPAIKPLPYKYIPPAQLSSSAYTLSPKKCLKNRQRLAEWGQAANCSQNIAPWNTLITFFISEKKPTMNSPQIV